MPTPYRKRNPKERSKKPIFLAEAKTPRVENNPHKGRPFAYSKFKRIKRAHFEESRDLGRLIKEAVQTQSFGDARNHTSFEQTELSKATRSALEKRGIVHPTPIQESCLPLVVQDRTVIAVANTGTGKTGVFVWPLQEKLKANKIKQVLCLLPTRELSEQVAREWAEWLPKEQLVLITGGESLRSIVAKLPTARVVIGTPGRVLDILQKNPMSPNVIVMDEVDRIFDLGFRDAVKDIVSKCGPDQFVALSATLPLATKNALKKMLPEVMSRNATERATAPGISQSITIYTDADDHIDKLHDLLLDRAATRVLVFVNTKEMVDMLVKELNDRGFKAKALHAGESRGRRKTALAEFIAGELPILVATDIAARGLDIPDVTHVVNFELPDSFDDYIHRIGRTGRAGKTGSAITLLMKGV